MLKTILSRLNPHPNLPHQGGRNRVFRPKLDKAKARGYKILSMKFLSYFLLIVALAMMLLVPAAVMADG